MVVFWQHGLQMNNVTLVGIIEEELENINITFFQSIIKHMTSFKTNLKWKYLWKCIHERSFGVMEQ